MNRRKKIELYIELQAKYKTLDKLVKKIQSLDMMVVENRILVVELRQMIRCTQLDIKDLKYYYKHYDRLERRARNYENLQKMAIQSLQLEK